VVVDGTSLAVTRKGARLAGIEKEGVAKLAELRWSADSAAFFVTQSYGGEVGEWLVWVYRIQGDRVQRTSVTQEVAREFKKHYRCREPEEPNIGAVKWLEGSNKLLLVAEVPPHSSCPEMGKVKGYVVEVPGGRIVQEFGDRELSLRWGRELGRRLSPN